MTGYRAGRKIMDWNDERTAALKQMWMEGMSASQVARQLGGVSRNAVIGKVHRLGLNSRDVPSRPRSLGGRPAGSGGVRATVVQARRATPAATPRPAPVRAPVRVFDMELAPTASLLSLTAIRLSAISASADASAAAPAPIARVTPAPPCAVGAANRRSRPRSSTGCVNRPTPAAARRPICRAAEPTCAVDGTSVARSE